jgi:hypothetical protein
MDRELAEALDHIPQSSFLVDLLKLVHNSNKESSAVSRSFVRRCIAQLNHGGTHSRLMSTRYRISNIKDSQDMKILKWAFEVQPKVV